MRVWGWWWGDKNVAADTVEASSDKNAADAAVTGEPNLRLGD